MTATRLTRSGRSRFLIGLGLIVIMFLFVAIFHSSQTQLDESRQQLLICEHQQEALNARMQAIIEHKFRLERSLEAERKEHLETRQNFEKRAVEQFAQNAKAKMTSNLQYDNLNQRYKLLQKEHGDLVEDCSKTKKSHLEVVNSLETKMKSLQSQLQQVRSLNDKDIDELKTKYDTLVQEKDRLEILLKSTSQGAESYKKKFTKLTDTINEYKSNCAYKPKMDNDDPIEEKPVHSAIVSNSNSHHQQAISNHPLDKPLVQKSFNEQQLMIPKPLVSSEDKNKPVVAAAAVAGAENVQQVPPLNSTGKSSTVAAAAGAAPEVDPAVSPLGAENSLRHALSVAHQSSTSAALKAKRSSTANGSGNLSLKPPKPIPLGVAPIPENFEYLLNNNHNNDEQQQTGNKVAHLKQKEVGSKPDTDNNRYVNVVDELIGKSNIKNEGGELDNGAHEVKDNDFIGDKNDDNVNNGAEEDNNNFFDGKIAPNKNNGDHGDGDDIEMFGMGGHKLNHKEHDDDLAPIANALLDADNLNNEVAGDQGKEQFEDGLHLDEGNEEEEDDDYSNPAARQQEGPAIRN